jgi:O-antigen/teichoic acid export membrane protein
MAEKENDKTKLAIIWDAGRLWYSTAIEQIAALIRGLIVPGLLGPTYYGILGGLNLIIQYGQYADFGVTNGLYREFPMYKKKGDDETTFRLTRSAFAFNLYTAIIPAFILITAAILLKPKIRNVSFWGIIAFSIIFLLYRLTFFYQTLLKAKIDFKSAGRSIALRGTVTLAAVVFLTYLFGMYGLYAGLLLTGSIVCAYVALKAETRLSLITESRYLKELLRIGIPYFAVNLFGYFMISIDRITVLNFMSKTDMGYYTLAAVITTFVFSVPMNVGQVLGPRVFGVPRDGSLTGFETYLLKPTVLMTIFSSLLGGAAVLLLIPFIRYVLPDYTPSMQLIPPMFVAFTVLNGTHGSGLILIALHRFRALAVANLLAGAFIGVASWFVIENGLGFLWVAISAAVGIIAYAVFLQFTAWRVLKLPVSAGVTAVLYLFFPPGIMAGALFLAFFGSNLLLAPITPSPILPAWDLLYLAIRLIIYAVTAACLLYYAEKSTGVVGLVFNAFREAIRGKTIKR